MYKMEVDRNNVTFLYTFKKVTQCIFNKKCELIVGKGTTLKIIWKIKYTHSFKHIMRITLLATTDQLPNQLKWKKELGYEQELKMHQYQYRTLKYIETNTYPFYLKMMTMIWMRKGRREEKEGRKPKGRKGSWETKLYICKIKLMNIKWETVSFRWYARCHLSPCFATWYL